MWKPRRARKRSEPNELVLGQQQAVALRAETAHRAARDSGESPLKEARYEAPEELSLLQLVEAEADAIISGVASRYRDASPSDRISITSLLTMEDFYAITSFARRSAARALATSELEDLPDALVAIAMIESDRIDSRGISWAAAYIRLAGLRLAEPRTVDEMFETAADIAEPATSAILRSFAGSTYQEVCAGWLMTVLERSGHKVIVQTGGGRFEPSIDVLELALQLQQILNIDGFLTADPVIGSRIGFRWLDSSPDSKRILERSVASARVVVLGRPDSPPMEQLFLAYVYELSSASDAAEFNAAWGQGERDFASLAVNVGTLVVLLISRSSLVGVPTVESDERLARFAHAVRSILNNTEMPG